jgi:hypothetical protein
VWLEKEVELVWKGVVHWIFLEKKKKNKKVASFGKWIPDMEWGWIPSLLWSSGLPTPAKLLMVLMPLSTAA